MRNWMILDPKDPVAVWVAEAPLLAGASLEAPSGTVHATADIPRGHKIALRAIPAGHPVHKFGHVIGVATADIAPGDHVHVHNVAMPEDDPAGEAWTSREWSARPEWSALPSTFRGYLRANGTAGTRNYLVVVSSVNCSATVVKAVCRRFQDRDLSAWNLDGIVPITHASGCAQAIGGLNYEVLNRTLAGWVFHPNVVGAVVIGLGCEGTTFKSILEHKRALALDSDIPLEALNIQDEGGTRNAIERGVEAVEKVLARIAPQERIDLPVSHLGIALNCGGSDAFSSLTANPALGLASDVLVAKGGMVSLAEIPECHGCERLLIDRGTDGEVKAKLTDVFAWWRDYAVRQKVSLNENLAPGNIAGGITTIVEKSLGAVAKGGSSPLTEVVDYSMPIRKKGFTVMNTPGFDPVSVTGLVAGGCTLVAFTTGRGSVYGCAIAPTIKIATNTAMFDRMRGDMDIDAGRALAEGRIDGVALDLYRLMVAVASGQKTCSEELGLGWEEFVPWPIAETL